MVVTYVDNDFLEDGVLLTDIGFYNYAKAESVKKYYDKKIISTQSKFKLMVRSKKLILIGIIGVRKRWI